MKIGHSEEPLLNRRPMGMAGAHGLRAAAWACCAAAAACVIGAFVVPTTPRSDAEPASTNPPPINQSAAPGLAPEGMVWVPGGWYWMGDEQFPDAQPVHLVYVDGFWMDRTEVTNAQFARFVKETGYRTIAERKPDPQEFPDVPADKLVAGSIVFTPPARAVDLNEHLQWWKYVPGANWQHPEGPGSNLDGREQHPVVQVAWHDAAAYAKWAGKRLPDEAEWEFAARGGLDRQRFCWGNELKVGGKWQSNIWQGEFPHQNTEGDGFRGTAPVGSFPANAYGVCDLSGNVWEWCADWYQPDYYASSPRRNPLGPGSSFDPQEPGMPKRVQRGGSFLCSDSYCVRYLPAGRGKGELSSAASHIGFRCVKSAELKETK